MGANNSTGNRFNPHAAYKTSKGIGDAAPANSIKLTTQIERPSVHG
jgi:hypothetical protein